MNRTARRGGPAASAAPHVPHVPRRAWPHPARRPRRPVTGPDTPAPAWFLPAFDNAVLAFDDRSRILDDADRVCRSWGPGSLLVDGRVAGTWTTSTAEGGVLREGERLAVFLVDGEPAGGVRLTAR